MTRWVATQLGAREYYAIPRMLALRGELDALYTDIWTPWASNVPLPGKLASLSSRSTHELDGVDVFHRTLRALFAMSNLNMSAFHRWLAAGAAFGGWVRSHLERKSLGGNSAVFGYTCGSLEILATAHERGALAVHGQVDPGLAWYRLRHEEMCRWPRAELRTTLPPSRFVERITSEWEIADRIIVNSVHAQASLESEGVSISKMRVVPLCYDSPISIGAPSRPSTRFSTERFKVIFVGNVTLMKGFQYLAQAALLLDKGFEFRAIGAIGLAPDFLRKNNHWPVAMQGRLNRTKLEREYARSQVLVFPTLSDGFGIVQLEAQARGIPVIATPNCGDVVIDGVTGYIVPIRNPEAIANRLQRLRDDPELYQAMSAAAIQNARRFTLSEVSNALGQTAQ